MATKKLSVVLFQQAVDLAWDRQFDVNHTYISGMPYGFQPTSLEDVEKNKIVHAIADGLGNLDKEVIDFLANN